MHRRGYYRLYFKMHGIPDFEKRVEEFPSSELTPFLSKEIGRIPWKIEKEELMPKPVNKHKFVYKSDFLSDRLIEQQERAQAFKDGFIVKTNKNLKCICILFFIE